MDGRTRYLLSNGASGGGHPASRRRLEFIILAGKFWRRVTCFVLAGLSSPLLQSPHVECDATQICPRSRGSNQDEATGNTIRRSRGKSGMRARESSKGLLLRKSHKGAFVCSRAAVSPLLADARHRVIASLGSDGWTALSPSLRAKKGICLMVPDLSTGNIGAWADVAICMHARKNGPPLSSSSFPRALTSVSARQTDKRRR